MTTPLMSLNEIISGVGGDSPSTAWNKVILNFQKLDSHNHTDGNGAKITTGALNIDNNLNINSFALTNANQIRFTNLSSGLTDNYGLYVVNNNLVFRSSTTTIPLTTGGTAIAGNPGNILNMTASQSVSYDTGFYRFFQNTDILGTLRSGGIAIGSSINPNASTFVTLQANPSSGYFLTFPAADPAANQMLLSDASGNLSWVDALYKTGTISANQIVIGDGANNVKGLTLSANHLILGTAGIPVSGQLINAYVSASAAIAGTKIAPNFGNQNIVTTGTLSTGSATLSALSVTTTISAAGITSTGPNNFSNSAQTFTVAGPSTFNNTVSIPSSQFTVGGASTFNGNAAFNGTITTNMLPDTTNTRQLGSSSNSWLSLFVRDLTTYGANILGTSSSDSITFNARAASSLVPTTNNSYDLGSSGLRWATVNTTTVNAEGNIFVSVGNTTGNGIYLADDGEIVDNNDSACTMRFNDGVKITAGKGNNTLAHHLDNDGILYNSSVVSSLQVQAQNIFATGLWSNTYGQGAIMTWNQPLGSGRAAFFNNKGGGVGGFEFYNSNAGTGNPANLGDYTSLATLNQEGDLTLRRHIYVGNSGGGRIFLSDDGDIADLNDGYASMRFSQGVRIYSANAGGSPVITFNSTGNITTNGSINITGNIFALSSNVSSTTTTSLSVGGEVSSSLIPSTSGIHNLGSSSKRWATLFSVNNVNVSDARLKTSIEFMPSMLSKIMKLKPRTWKSKYEDYNVGQRGFIAQELQEVFPEVVKEDDTEIHGNKNILSIQTYGSVEFDAILVKAIQELKEEIDILKAKQG